MWNGPARSLARPPDRPSHLGGGVVHEAAIPQRLSSASSLLAHFLFRDGVQRGRRASLGARSLVRPKGRSGECYFRVARPRPFPAAARMRGGIITRAIFHRWDPECPPACLPIFARRRPTRHNIGSLHYVNRWTRVCLFSLHDSKRGMSR